MNLKNKECGKGSARVQQKQRIRTTQKVHKEFTKNRDYMKYHSAKRVQDIQGLRGIGKGMEEKALFKSSCYIITTT